MLGYRRNADKDLRKLQREVSGGDMSQRSSLLAQRIRSGIVTREEVTTAAYFNHPVALEVLGMERVAFEDFFGFIDGSTKDLIVRWSRHVASHALTVWDECMVRRATESSEERALSSISPELRYMIEAPREALAALQNWQENVSALETLCDLLEEISCRSFLRQEAIHAIKAIGAATKVALVPWSSRGSSRGVGRTNPRRCNIHARRCYKFTIRAITGHTDCSVEDAASSLRKTILNNMFTSL